MLFEEALGIVRILIKSGYPKEDAINSIVIPSNLREKISEAILREENMVLVPAGMLVSNPTRVDWLSNLDRSTWYYWLTLRTYLLGIKNWTSSSVRSLDETTDRILAQLAFPNQEQFDIRGLVVGYVQSGKTSNYTSLIAKAADVGYRLIIVLSGIDNGLRRQTQIRLNRELVGYTNDLRVAVPLPPMGKQWHQFTTEELYGDFQPGFANYAALQGTQPVLLVIKKNGTVLRRLHSWLDAAPEDVRNTLPVLVIDDEADQASIDTKGSYQAENEPIPIDFTEPTVINRLIRELLSKFQRKAYVAYTATPFANILIPHDTFNPRVEDDLYPRDFIVDLPKPEGYFGAEEQFGRFDPDNDQDVGGLDIIRFVPEQELEDLRNHNILPSSLETAILDFVLAGSARLSRGQGDSPATMLLHGSHLVLKQAEMANLITQKFSELRDEWRYQRSFSILTRLRDRWEKEFRPITQSVHPALDVPFIQIEPFLGQFFEAIQIRVINSNTGELLDYEREPNLKAIAIGGNRLSRGLTLEGLITSYFFRTTAMYDTLMQMGRWFGFRGGYEDLTRIYMTEDLSGWFSILALVEYELRQDIRMYEIQNVTPLELGTRILKHPGMLVTNRLKQRFANTIIVEQSYSNQVLQTFRFPFRNPAELKPILDSNLEITNDFINHLKVPHKWDKQGPLWFGIQSNKVINFLNRFKLHSDVRNISIPLIISFIQRQNELEELVTWTVAIRGRGVVDPNLGSINFGLDQPIPLISRTRLKSDRDSLGVITSPGDEEAGLPADLLEKAKVITNSNSPQIGRNPAARLVRPPTEGLLLLYPVSRNSGYNIDNSNNRTRLFEDPNSLTSQDIICFAVSFPKSDKTQGILGEYIVGTVDWREM